MNANAERRARVPAFLETINTYCTMSISVGLRKSEYFRAWKEFKLRHPNVEVSNADNPFSVLFLGMHQSLASSKIRPYEIVGDATIQDWIVDQSSEAGLVNTEWSRYNMLFSETERAQFSARPIFRNDKEFLPLQGADFLAWWCRRWIEDGVDFGDSEQMLVYGRKLETPHAHYWYHEQSIFEAFSDLIHR